MDMEIMMRMAMTDVMLLYVYTEALIFACLLIFLEKFQSRYQLVLCAMILPSYLSMYLHLAIERRMQRPRGKWLKNVGS